MADNPLRFHEPHVHLETPFGGDAFGKKAEAFARFFGTPKFLIGQTFLVLVWIAVNAVAAGLRWDPYPLHPAQPGLLDPSRVCSSAHLARANPPGRARQGPIGS